MNNSPKNILGTALQACCFQPKTGYFRDGFCRTIEEDTGSHVICAVITDEFLEYTKSRGNDLSTPKPEWDFPGLKAGDKWCLCAVRWAEAEKIGKAPKVFLEACHEKALQYVSLELLKKYEESSEKAI
ncbi:MAG: hypothetical protein ACI85I_001859 [Arenicella sp.]|jgi:uncharacterized protein (DUF2237 family)